VSLSTEDGSFQLGEIEWPVDRLEQGFSVKLKKAPFKVAAMNGDMDGVINSMMFMTPVHQPGSALRTRMLTQ
jgi:hypothetical protein